MGWGGAVSLWGVWADRSRDVTLCLCALVVCRADLASVLESHLHAAGGRRGAPQPVDAGLLMAGVDQVRAAVQLWEGGRATAGCFLRICLGRQGNGRICLLCPPCAQLAAWAASGGQSMAEGGGRAGSTATSTQHQQQQQRSSRNARSSAGGDQDTASAPLAQARAAPSAPSQGAAQQQQQQAQQQQVAAAAQRPLVLAPPAPMQLLSTHPPGGAPGGSKPSPMPQNAGNMPWLAPTLNLQQMLPGAMMPHLDLSQAPNYRHQGGAVLHHHPMAPHPQFAQLYGGPQMHGAPGGGAHAPLMAPNPTAVVFTAPPGFAAAGNAAPAGPAQQQPGVEHAPLHPHHHQAHLAALAAAHPAAPLSWDPAASFKVREAPCRLRR